MDPTFYLGRVGALVALPSRAPSGAGGFSADPARVGASHTSLTGLVTYDTFGVYRTWSWKWEQLTPAEVAYVEALHYGLVQGPLRLLDPNRANRFAENVASGGSLLRGATGPRGFTVTSGALTYRGLDQVPADRATLGPQRMLRGAQAWARQAAVVSTMWPYDARETDKRWRVPVLPGETLEFSLWTTGLAGSAISLPWREYLADGGTVDHATVPVTVPVGAWAQTSTTVTAGPSTVAVACGLRQEYGPLGPLHTTAWQVAPPDAETLPPGMLLRPAPADPGGGWRIGGGAPSVTVVSGSEVYQLYGLRDAALVVVESR